MTAMLRRAVVTLAGVALAGMAVPAWAQVDGPIEFATDFAFVANGKTFPAGKYEVRPLEDGHDVLRLAALKGNDGILLDVEPTTGPRAPQTDVVFDEYGSRYVLRSFAVAGESEGAVVVTARRDAERAAVNPTQRHVHGRHHHEKTTTPTT